MNFKILFLMVSSFVALTRSGHGEDIYVAQNSSGADTGVDAANAKSFSWLNTPSNWGTGGGLVSAGDTVRLTGTFDSQLVIRSSGSAGNPITIHFESGAKFSRATWPTGAIKVNGRSHISILNGKIETTDNGTAFGNQVDSIGIDAFTGNGGTSLVISNMYITNMYTRTMRSATDGRRYGTAITCADWNGLWIMDCWLHEGDTMIGGGVSTSATATNINLLRNTIGRCNHGISFGTSGGSVNAWIKGMTISSNRIDDLDVWDNHNNLHLDGMILFHEATGGGFDGLTINANHIGPNIGQTNTAAIFIPTYTTEALLNLRMFNNLSTCAAGRSWNNGHFSVGPCSNSIVANNTFYQVNREGIGIKASMGMLGITNNIFYNTGIAIYLGGANLAVFTGFIDYNVYYGSPALAFQVPLGQDTFAQWKSETGYDANSVTSKPLLDAKYMPTASDTVAKNTGQNLSVWFTADKNGVPRSAWYSGAFEYAPDGRPEAAANLRRAAP